MFIIPGKPQGKARPRVTRNGTYTPQRTKDYQNRIKQAYNGEYLPEKPLIATIVCYYSIAKNTSKAKRRLMLEGKMYPLVKPDLDNVAKVILDALNGVAYKDDNLVVCLCIAKYYGEPRIEVKITQNEG